MPETTINVDIPTAVKKVLGGRPSPGHEKVREEVVKNLRETGITVTEADEAYLGVHILKYHEEVLNKVPTKPEKEPTEWDRARDILFKRFGSDWGQSLVLKVRIRDFSWFIMLIEQGIAKQTEVWKEQNKGRLDTGEVMSIASWTSDLHDLVESLKTAEVVPAPKKSKPR